MKRSIVLGLLVVMGSLSLFSEADAGLCNRVTCSNKYGLKGCMVDKSYGSYQDIIDGGDNKCAAAANTLCSQNNCDLSSISFDCSSAPDCASS